MLVLDRYEGQEIVIAHDIVIRVLGVKGRKAIIGINAPRSIPVFRREIYDQVCEQADAMPRSLPVPKEESDV